MPETVSKLYRALVWNERVSLAVLDTTALVNEAIVRHALSPVAAAALGRTLTATAYLAGWLKEEKSSLSVSVDGGGAGGKIGTAADGALNIRGFIEHPDVQLPPRADGKLDVGRCVGKNGTFTVIRDDGEGIPFVGTSPLVSGEIAEDLSAYFLTSEQRPTAVALGVKIAPDGRCIGAGGVFFAAASGRGRRSAGFCAGSDRQVPESLFRHCGSGRAVRSLRLWREGRFRARRALFLPLFAGTGGIRRTCHGTGGCACAACAAGRDPRALPLL